METAKLFKNGRSQAVRLPKKCNFEGTEVIIKKVGPHVILSPKNEPWKIFRASLDQFTSDFCGDGRQELPLEEREEF
jgi:antitoxin VapB